MERLRRGLLCGFGLLFLDTGWGSICDSYGGRVELPPAKIGIVMIIVVLLRHSMQYKIDPGLILCLIIAAWLRLEEAY